MRTSRFAAVVPLAIATSVAALYVLVMLALGATSPDPWVLAVPASALAAWIGLASWRAASLDRGAAPTPWGRAGLGVGFAVAAVALPVLTVAG